MKKENITFNSTVKRHNPNANDIKLSKGVIHSVYNDPVKEASRCLQCNVLCNKCVEVCPNRANIIVKSSVGLRDKYQVVHLDNLCNECGNCETFCPYEGKPYKDKFTVSFSENIFDPDFLIRMNPIGV